MNFARYPCIKRFSRQRGIPVDNLIRGFLIESDFHERIATEDAPEKRKMLYQSVYEKVHTLYGREASSKARTVRLFKRELTNKSILDVGCGNGAFLQEAKTVTKKRLVGVDVQVESRVPDVELIEHDVVSFAVGKFDVVFSDNVIEHLSRKDWPNHFRAVYEALNPGGIFICIAPNRLFGPHDITRIIDCSHCGRVSAQGTHLSETSYVELLPVLDEAGFTQFRTVFPLQRVKYLFPWLRLPGRLPCFLERITPLLHRIRWRGQVIARFDVTLICRRSPG